jgi:hypothetical protein
MKNKLKKSGILPPNLKKKIYLNFLHGIRIIPDINIAQPKTIFVQIPIKRKKLM